MLINNVELEDLDFLEAGTMERIEQAQTTYMEKSKKNDFTKYSEMIKYNCELVFNLFNTIFGEGTDVKVFGNRCNLMDCVKAVTDLFTYTENKQKEAEEEYMILTNKYLDRAQKKVE